MANGILLIEFRDKATDEAIQSIISKFYGNNTDTIKGMTYYETDEQSLIKEINELCINKKENKKGKNKQQTLIN